MKFCNQQHQFYCRIDLHPNSMHVCIVDHSTKATSGPLHCSAAKSYYTVQFLTRNCVSLGDPAVRRRITSARCFGQDEQDRQDGIVLIMAILSENNSV